MDNNTDLKQQAEEITKQVDDFLKGDHSHLPVEEYSRLQQQMLARQSMAMGALLQHMGFKEKKPLMQSEDMVDLKRRAGITESGESFTNEFMQIVDLAQKHMHIQRQKYPENQNTNAAGTAVNIKRKAEEILKRYDGSQ